MSTRRSLQSVATHVLARRRHAVTGRFGLRATPCGFGTPMFDLEVVRVAGATLIHEVGGDTTHHVPLRGNTIAELARLVGVDLGTDFEVGHDTPPLDAGAPLDVDAGEAAAIGAWFDLGWRALDAVAAVAMAPSVIQLWPEHFDAGCSVEVRVGERCNLGASPGDDAIDEPYLYIGPWTADRPGDDGYWNAPFGAVLRRRECAGLDAGVDFLRRGLALLS